MPKRTQPPDRRDAEIQKLQADLIMHFLDVGSDDG